MSKLPLGPWLDLSVDFCGPLPTGEYLLVITDEYSQYSIVEVIQGMSAETVIPYAEKAFAMFGYPKVVKSNNGPPFQGKTWKQKLWIKHNAQAESLNTPLMKAI